MTVHIGFANPGAALLASDSQGSHDISEYHGWQKQFAGPDFLVGVAGLWLVLDELFRRMQDAFLQADDPADEPVRQEMWALGQPSFEQG